MPMKKNNYTWHFVTDMFKICKGNMKYPYIFMSCINTKPVCSSVVQIVSAFCTQKVQHKISKMKETKDSDLYQY